MWINPQQTVDLFTCAKEILKGKLHFLCNAPKLIATGSNELRILAGKTHLQIKLEHLQKLWLWIFGSILNGLFIKGCYTQIKFSKK